MYSYAFMVDGSPQLVSLHSLLQMIIAILGVMTTAAIFVQTRALVDQHKPLGWKQAIHEAWQLLFGLL